MGAYTRKSKAEFEETLKMVYERFPRLEERKNAMQQDYLNTENKLFDEYQLTRREAEATVETTVEENTTE